MMLEWMLIAALVILVHSMAAIAAQADGKTDGPPARRNEGETGVAFIGRCFYVWFVDGLKGYASLLYGIGKFARWLVTRKESNN